MRNVNREGNAIAVQRPFIRLKNFASRLGWNALRLHSTASWPEKFDSHKGINRIYWYQTTDPKFFLAIHEFPFNQIQTYRATVKAFRFGVSLASPVSFELFENQEAFEAEASRVFPVLSRRNWKSRNWRKAESSRSIIDLHQSKKKRGKRSPKNVDSIT